MNRRSCSGRVIDRRVGTPLMVWTAGCRSMRTYIRGEQMIETSYRRILIPTDGSENTRAAVAYALDLARQTDAKVTAISVNDISNYAAIPGEHDAESPLYQASQAAIGDAIEMGAAKGVRVEGMIVSGIPKRDIVEASKDHDLVVMGTTGRTGLPHLLLGSVAERVVRKAYCPVIVVRTGVTSSFKCDRILIATDGSENSAPAVREGLNLARAFGAQVTALSVSDDTGLPAAGRGSAEGRVLASEAVAEVENEGRKLGIEVTPSVPTGSPDDAIVDASTEHDLLVMGTHGRSGLAHLRMGSVAERVIRFARCPVMVVKGHHDR
jgi:nucleotide-binding universal stress UspA family protein